MPSFGLQHIGFFACSPYARNDFRHFHKGDTPLCIPFCHLFIPMPGLNAYNGTHITVVEPELIERRNSLFILRHCLYPV